jgi:electron transport complex protein RnfA
MLVNNFVLVQLLGVCQFVGASGRFDAAVALAGITALITTGTSLAGWLLQTLLLTPLSIEWLRLPALLLIVAAAVQIAETLLQRSRPDLVEALGIFLPLTAANCAVLGVLLLNHDGGLGPVSATLHGLGAGVGFALALILFAAVRERLVLADVPQSFRGASINLITAGLAALAFMGFADLV